MTVKNYPKFFKLYAAYAITHTVYSLLWFYMYLSSCISLAAIWQVQIYTHVLLQSSDTLTKINSSPCNMEFNSYFHQKLFLPMQLQTPPQVLPHSPAH